ncbi:MAG: NTP transferase domain-containing protein, partial [Paeniclostridium sordellii]|nr:NTP transferase domain-containing protein [Paeniclostridium sordellii]
KLGIRNSKACEGYMFFVGDQPFLDEFDIKKLISKFKDDKSKIIIPICENRKGNPVIFPNSLVDKLMMLKKDEKGKKVISEYDKIEYVKVKEKTLLDIDTQEDYDCLINLY